MGSYNDLRIGARSSHRLATSVRLWSCPGLVEGELLRCAPGGVDTACSCSTTSGRSGGKAVVGG
jgi:hypothetical protein